MLTLLISILMSLGIRFTTLESGQLQISSSDAVTLQSSEEFQKLGDDANESIVINDSIDPASATSAGE